MNSKKRYLLSFMIFMCLALMLLVHPVQAATVKLNATTLYLDPGTKASLILKGVPASAYKGVTWTSSNSSVISLENSNPYIAKSIEAEGTGTAIVTAKYNGKSYRCRVIVSRVYSTIQIGTQRTRSGNLEGKNYGTLGVSVSVADRTKTKTAQIRVYGNKNTKIRFKSSNTSIATVSSTGKITFKSSGVVEISAVLYNKSTSAKLPNNFSFAITVNEPAFKLNSSVYNIEKAGYEKSNSIAKNVVKYLNVYRKNAGYNANLTLDSDASHASGYALYYFLKGDANNYVKNYIGKFTAYNKLWDYSGKILREYGVSYTDIDIAVDAGYRYASAKTIAKSIWDEYTHLVSLDKANNEVYTYPKIGVYVGANGTFCILYK